jgi:predicted RNA-binding Zn ribbon-like protein
MGVVFVGGNLALDFVGTLNERGSSRVEQLNGPADLAGWFVLAGVVDSAPAASAADLEAALAVREALFALISGLIDQRPLPRPALALVNQVAAGEPPAVRVAQSGQLHRSGDVDAALAAVARDGLALFDRRADAVLKWCADNDCTHPFLDRSRGARRRWCEMAGCGDRAKAAAYRARRRHAESVGVCPETTRQK